MEVVSREEMTIRSKRQWKLTNVPPGDGGLLGISVILPISSWNVVKISCINHADRSNHLHPVQYSMVNISPLLSFESLLLYNDESEGEFVAAVLINENFPSLLLWISLDMIFPVLPVFALMKVVFVERKEYTGAGTRVQKRRVEERLSNRGMMIDLVLD